MSAAMLSLRSTVKNVFQCADLQIYILNSNLRLLSYGSQCILKSSSELTKFTTKNNSKINSNIFYSSSAIPPPEAPYHSQYPSPLCLSPRTRAIVDRIIRVDHAGELGADRIYAGQYAVLKRSPVGATIQDMWEQEKEHLNTFSNLIPPNRVRPTVLLPVWNVAAYALGAGTALLGSKAAMACTVAVETVIADHYNKQLRQLLQLKEGLEAADEENEKEVNFISSLMSTIKRIRDEEIEHHDTGIVHDAKKAPGYEVISSCIKGSCKVAIWLSERV